MSWPKALQVVEKTDLVMECVIASTNDQAPVETYILLNSRRLPALSEELYGVLTINSATKEIISYIYGLC